MLVFICLGLILSLSLIYKRGKFQLVVLLIIGTLIMGLNDMNPDYDEYVLMFNHSADIDDINIFTMLDIGFKQIQFYFKEHISQDYTDFRLVLSCVIFIILGIVSYRNCGYYNLFLAYYILFYLALDSIQIRNFASFILLLPFLINFLKDPSTKPLIIYLCGVTIAFTIHFSAIIYLMFCMLYFKSNKTRIILIFVFCICILPFKSLFSSMAMVDRVEDYADPSILGSVVCILLIILNYLFIKWFNQKYIYNKENKNMIISWNPSVMVQVNLILFCLIPFVFMNASILRIFRFITIINSIYLIDILYCNKIKSNNTIILLLITLYMFLITVTRTSWIENTGYLLNNPLF